MLVEQCEILRLGVLFFPHGKGNFEFLSSWNNHVMLLYIAGSRLSIQPKALRSLTVRAAPMAAQLAAGQSNA